MSSNRNAPSVELRCAQDLALTRGRGRKNCVTWPISSLRNFTMSTSAARAKSTEPRRE